MLLHVFECELNVYHCICPEEDTFNPDFNGGITLLKKSHE